jgi:hypothetical protein
MLCAKCHQNKATVHITSDCCGKVEKIDLCQNCAPNMGFNVRDLKQLEKFSVIGKKCEFCDKPAVTGEFDLKGHATYWCLDCGMELSKIFLEIVQSENPNWLEQPPENFSFLSLCADPKMLASMEATMQQAVQTLKNRKSSDTPN